MHLFGQRYVSKLVERDAQHDTQKPLNERTLEYRFALQVLGDYCPSHVLDVGTGKSSWPHLLHTCRFKVTAIDNVRDYWPNGMFNRHWPVHDVDILLPADFSETFSAVTCISVLEHIENDVLAVKQMVKLIDPGGILVLTCPYNAHTFSQNVYSRPDATWPTRHPYRCKSYSAEQREQWLKAGLTLVHEELWQLFSGPIWRTGSSVPWKRAASESEPHQLGLFAFQKTA